ncbi:MAG: alpha/beta fold hydrolase [Myxococcota bacterium]
MSEVKRARVGSIEMAYEERGAGARPFVLVHGYTGSRDDFADVHDALAERGRTLLVDQRGHGDSTNPGDPEAYGLEVQVDDLVGLLDTLAIERCDLLGHSMGGMVALRLALAHPDRVASLILMDTSPEPIALMPVPMMQAGARLGREHGMGRVVDLMRAAPSPARAQASRRCEEEMGSDRYWERIRRKYESMDPEAMHALAAVLADHPPVVERLGEIGCPTLVLVGEQDVPFLEPSRTLAERIPGARLCVVADAAHSPQLENTAAWLDAVRAHLARARS